MNAETHDQPAGDWGGSLLLAPSTGGHPEVRVRWDQLRITAARSSGPGGQNVNKVSTKVEVRVWLSALALEAEALSRLRRIAGRRVTDRGELVITEDGSRSQSANRAEAIERLRGLVGQALIRPKPRVKTKPTKGSERRRVEGKKRTGEIKKMRRRPADE